MKLTAKQEKFVLGLIEGKSQRKAFIDAGYSIKGLSENQLDSKASALAKIGKVSDRYEQLKSEAVEQSKWTRQKAFEEYEWLKNMAKNDIEEYGLKKANADAFISGLDGMNKMSLGNEELANKKIMKEIEMLDARIKQIKGVEKDTSLLNHLIEVVNSND